MHTVEVTTRYVTTVDSLPEAWAFVMERIDRVGPDPSIEISPMWSYSVADMDRDEDYRPPRQFSVVVHGMIPERSIDVNYSPEEGETP